MKSDLKIQLRVNQQYHLICHVDTAYNAMREAGIAPGDELTVTIHGNKRSLSKNALSQVWYRQLDKERFNDYPAGYARKYCKLHFGIPLICEDEDYSDWYFRFVKKRYTYEEKIELMEHLSVTSRDEMTEDRMFRYLQTMQHVFAEDGCILTTPKDSEYEKWCERAA